MLFWRIGGLALESIPCVEEGKQAEFLIEGKFPWKLVTSIGIRSQALYARVQNALSLGTHQPAVQIKPDWYY